MLEAGGNAEMRGNTCFSQPAFCSLCILKGEKSLIFFFFSFHGPCFLVFVKEISGGSDSKESACCAGDLGQEDPLEKGMTTHSSIPAWRIPWTEEPGGQ